MRSHIRSVVLYLGCFLCIVLLVDVFRRLFAVEQQGFGLILLGVPILSLMESYQNRVHWSRIIKRNGLILLSLGTVLYVFVWLSAHSIGSPIFVWLSILYGLVSYGIGWMSGRLSERIRQDGIQEVVPVTEKREESDIRLTQLIDQYCVIEMIGEGGMGRVYRARHLNPDTFKRQGEVAIKLMRESYAQDIRLYSRFVQEALLGIELKHQSLTKTHELIDTNEHFGLVMEYVDGPSLRAYLSQKGRTYAEIFHVLSALARVLDYLHQEGLVHRDVKPCNIRIRKNGLPVLLDLGIAKTRKSLRMTQTGITIGTVDYMAPEQFFSSNVGPKADQYALGIIVYELFARRLPWEPKQNHIQISTIKKKGILLPLQRQRQNIPLSVAESVHRALARRPKERFPSCTAFVDALFLAVRSSSISLTEPIQFSDRPKRGIHDKDTEEYTAFGKPKLSY
ncbi:MAG: serine/threonine-protein kinase [Myxococcota bacterium]|nr:serine/threonine-protein kinase [Myxococcota bacterium]